MKEYIERALAVQELEVLRQEYEMHDDCDELVARRCRDALSAVPAADVAEVRHGKWVEYPRAHYFKCSECKYTVPYRKAIFVNGNREYDYCPSCGARMDKEDNYVRND